MAKDRRGDAPRKEVTKGQFIARIVAALLLIAAGIAVVVSVCITATQTDESPKPSPAPVTTTVPATTVTTASTATVTSTTEAVTTTTIDTTTAQTTVTTTQTTTTTAITTTVTTTTAVPPATGDVPWNLRLVNKWTPMTQAESETLPITALSGAESVDSRIVEPLNRMLSDASRYGLWVTSSYRPYSMQEQLYNNKVQRVMNEQGCSYEDALVIAATEVAAPGTSEHNTGLAVDLLYTGMWELEEYWEDGEVFDWLMEHCHEYGFILRFPKGKEAITGVIYEPWHYRYVGVEAATYIMANNITLEEYVQQQGLY